MSEHQAGWHIVGSISRMEIVVAAGVLNATRGLETFVGHPISMGTIQARMVRFDDLAASVGDPIDEMVGIYLQIKGDMGGQALLILPRTSALNLVSLLMRLPPGTIAELGEVERSALAEVGDVMVSYFLNAVAGLTGRPLLPSTPTVVVDMLANVLDVFVAPEDDRNGELMVMETVLNDTEGLVQAYFWILPDFTT
jgi:chemotaxis protein CheC